MTNGVRSAISAIRPKSIVTQVAGTGTPASLSRRIDTTLSWAAAQAA
jgi:hypothetical protein